MNNGAFAGAVVVCSLRVRFPDQLKPWLMRGAAALS